MSDPASPPPPETTLNRTAVLSVIFGVAAFASLLVHPFLSFVLSIPCLTTGVAARREISASNPRQRGFDLAGMGLAAGAATLLLSIAALGLRLSDYLSTTF